MKEYDELENETVQVNQTVAGQGEERVEVNEELEQTVEESRTRKRGNEEAESIEQKLVTGSLIWHIFLGEINYNT